MTAADESGGDGLWGYCPACERWLLSTDWSRGAGQSSLPRCPTCSAVAFPVEERIDGVTRLRLELDLPPGAEMPILP